MKKILLLLSLISSICAYAQSVKEQISSKIPKGDKVFRYGYNELTTAEKSIYENVVDELIHFDANNAMPYYYHTVELKSLPSNITATELSHILARIKNDMPEMFVLGFTIPRHNGEYYMGRIGYAHTPESFLSDLEQMEYAFSQIAGSITNEMSTYTKLRILHDSFISWANYGDMSGADGGTAKGALVNRRAVCEGLSRGFLYLCQRVGLKCIYVSGSKIVSTEKNEWGNHAWNYVEIDGKWYLIDIANDGGFANQCGYISFLRGNDHISTNYSHYSISGEDSNCNGVYKELPPLAETTYQPETELKSYKVKFVNWNGYPIRTETIVEGTNAVEPKVPEREGYVFTGWDEDITKINADMTVTAQFDLIVTTPPTEPSAPELTIEVPNTTLCLGTDMFVTATTNEDATFIWKINGETQYSTDTDKSSELYIYSEYIGTYTIKVEATSKGNGKTSSKEVEIKTAWTPYYMLDADNGNKKVGEEIKLTASTFGDADEVNYEVYDGTEKIAVGTATGDFEVKLNATDSGHHTYVMKIVTSKGCAAEDLTTYVEIENVQHPTSISNKAAQNDESKIIKDGRFLIRKGGNTYDLSGMIQDE